MGGLSGGTGENGDQAAGGSSLRARHSFTDGLCLLPFLVAIVIFGFIYAWAARNGDLRRLYHGTDHKGRICGVSTEVAHAPFLYWCPLAAFRQGHVNVSLSQPVCVPQCPSGALATRSWLGQMHWVEPGCAEVSGAQGMVTYATVPLRERYCLPRSADHPELARLVSGHLRADHLAVLTESLASIPEAMSQLTVAFIVALLAGFVYLASVGTFAGAVARAGIACCAVGFFALGTLLRVSLMVSGEHGGRAFMRVLSVVSWIIATIVAVLACCLQRSLTRAADCMRVAGEGVFEMRPFLLVAPAMRALGEAALATALIHGLLLLCSACGPELAGAARPGIVVSITVYVLISIWIMGFVHALCQFIVAFIAAEYYHAPIDLDGEKDVGFCALWDGLIVGLVFHAGSLACGSLLALVFALAWGMLELGTLGIREGPDNYVAVCLTRCCFWPACCCGDSVGTFNSRNAYIDLAVNSRSFWDAVKRNIESRDMRRPATKLVGVTAASGSFSTTAIALAAGLVAAGLSIVEGEPLPVLLAAMVVGFRVAVCFTGVIDVISDTLVYCCGSDPQPIVTAPPRLRHLIENSVSNGGPGEVAGNYGVDTGC